MMMRHRLTALALVLSLGGIASSACLLNRPPVLNPTTATAITNALSAIKTQLELRNVDPKVIAFVTDAQTALAGDIAGKTWGEILRELMTNLYTQLPLSVQSDPKVWVLFAGIEVALATIGA